MDLAGFIAHARGRGERRLSFRELEKRADDLDHAYIWRLEKGDKATPSPATLQKLAQALELDEREREILDFFAKTKAIIDDTLFNVMLSRREIPMEDFEPVVTISFRGTRPVTEEDWVAMINKVREL